MWEALQAGGYFKGVGNWYTEFTLSVSIEVSNETEYVMDILLPPKLTDYIWIVDAYSFKL